MSNTSSTTTSLNVADTPASRTPIGREIPDSPASLAAVAPARLTPDAGKSPYTASSQIAVGPIKDVDSTVITGSHKSSSDDVSAKFSTDAFKNAGGPRTQMAGQQDSRNYNEDGKAFKSTSNSPDSDQGN